MWSFSRMTTFKQCPYKYKLKYLDGVKVDKPIEEDNALVLGTAIHKMLETGNVERGIDYYKSQLNIYSDLAVNEEIKLRDSGAKALSVVPNDGRHEVKIVHEDFIGFVDLIFNNCIYDFKYSASPDYLDGQQLSVYAYMLEQLGYGVDKMFYVWIPKTNIKQRKNETLAQFRSRLAEKLKNNEVKIIEKCYNNEQVEDYFLTVRKAKECTDFKKCQSRLCYWCEYADICETKEVLMNLPKAERKQRKNKDLIKLWIYGEPFSGKTTFANNAEMPLFLNTDGNVKYIDAPAVIIKDGTKAEGRLSVKTYGWKEFKDAIEELEKDKQGFKSIVVDLVEGVYELCRSYMYAKNGWQHESDEPFKAWDIIRKEFLDVMRRVTNLDMNVILISHENTERDITKASGSKVTAIKPNMQEKVAKQIAGMVDIVARIIVRDNRRILSFKTDETQFGGGRLDLGTNEINLNWEKFIETIRKDKRND